MSGRAERFRRGKFMSRIHPSSRRSCKLPEKRVNGNGTSMGPALSFVVAKQYKRDGVDNFIKINDE